MQRTQGFRVLLRSDVRRFLCYVQTFSPPCAAKPPIVMRSAAILSQMSTEPQITSVSAPLGYFQDRVFCACPRCDGPALVLGQKRFWGGGEAHLRCFACSFALEPAEAKWYGPLHGRVAQPCPFCRTRWNDLVRENEEVAEEHTREQLRCEACGRTSERMIAWRPHPHTASPRDPYFGLPLWLQIGCRGKTLWAYNGEHVAALRAYVASKDRDQWSRYKWSALTRLPSWVKASKNREAVVRCLSRLERKLKEVGCA